MPIPLIPLAIAAGGAAIGAIGSGANRSKAKKTMNSWYDYAEGFANTQRSLSTFDTPGGKSLLKIANRNYADNLDAINNRMVAGGATMENALAARQANNENRDKVNMQVLQADQKRRDAWDNQLLNLKGQRAEYTANNYLQAAQDWSQWGSQMASAGMGLMNAGLLGGAGNVADAASVARADMPSLPEIQNPISLPGAVQMQDQSWGSRGDTQGLGGLKGAHYENGILVRD